MVIVSVLSFQIIAQAKYVLVESCTTKDGLVELSIYSYEGGGSGYYKVTNNSTKKLRVGFKYTSNEGRIHTGSTPVDSGKSEIGSCFDAGTKNTGIKSVDIIEVNNED